MNIGRYQFTSPVVLAPMAGVTDLPFRRLCKRLGADYVVSEMVSMRPELRQSRKTRQRLNHEGETNPIIVQIVGGCPQMMAEAARYNVAHGAQIIDINMGCPAKKVCQKAAGSALMRDEELVKRILAAVVDAVDVPVTLKIRTGWDLTHRNGVAIAQIAENIGIQALAVHGRTRACAFRGEAEYDTIGKIKRAVSIPVLANGDLTSAEKAKQVMESTGVDGIMLGRVAQGKPWVFSQYKHFLQHGERLAPPTQQDVCDLLLEHLEALYQFYGQHSGVRIARKHVAWYCKAHDPNFRSRFNLLESAKAQLTCIQRQFQLEHPTSE